jgi:hypothetical protein
VNIQIELSKDVDYQGKKLGKYIWNLEEKNNHVTGFSDTLEECFVEIMRFKNDETKQSVL